MVPPPWYTDVPNRLITVTFKHQVSTCIKASSLSLILFHQTTLIPVLRKQLPSSLYLRAILLDALIFDPTVFVEMFSKSFIIQAFIALIVLASSLISSINASPIAPAGQFVFL